MRIICPLLACTRRRKVISTRINRCDNILHDHDRAPDRHPRAGLGCPRGLPTKEGTPHSQSASHIFFFLNFLGFLFHNTFWSKTEIIHPRTWLPMAAEPTWRTAFSERREKERENDAHKKKKEKFEDKEMAAA